MPRRAPELPPIPAKRYFTIGEVSELCAVKPHVLRYWEQEFSQLKPLKRRGNRRYYQHHEVLLIRRIRGLLYDQGFTISGARSQLEDTVSVDKATDKSIADKTAPISAAKPSITALPPPTKAPVDLAKLRDELQEALEILNKRR
ncbi:MAG: MerR family transcriptional regulator [Proteobacteria bacterium]|nr:MerR family transcriptional regulator [Pseudomonadota bacterium]MCL2307076.1 MerR family transcriptional regulator [Pseudomonadota bacterium]